MMRILAAALVAMGAIPAAEAADYRLTLLETGMRDYYCTYTARLENMSGETLDDLNGFFVLLAGDEPVGESRSSSFLNTPSDGTTSVVFEAPRAPCEDVSDLRFVVGACRIGRSFLDQADCAGRLETAPPITAAVAR